MGIRIATFTAVTAATMLWLALPVPARAQTAEPLEVQEKVDAALNALPLPDPTVAHLPAPPTAQLPLAGQPYEQQPAAVNDQGSAAGGGRRRP